MISKGRVLKRGQWQHFKRPNGTWDALCHKNGHVLGNTDQGYENLRECLNAVEAMSGSRESTLVEFKDRVRSPRRRISVQKAKKEIQNESN